MNEIYAFTQPPRSENIFACGLRWEDPLSPAESTASMFRMHQEGSVDFVYKWGTQGAKSFDVCQGITYDVDRREVVMIIETTSAVLRPDLNSYSVSKANKDILIITMRDSGQISNAYNINMGKGKISMFISGNGLFVHENYLIFGGFSYAYDTRYQQTTYSELSPQFDTFIFKYDPTVSEDCLYQYQFSSNEISSILEVEGTDKNYISSSNVKYDKDYSTNLFLQMNNQYLGYSSRYASAFDLQDSIKIPRMCASESSVLSKNTTYYRGQNEMAYPIRGDTSEAIYNKYGNKITWMMQNGTNAEGRMGRFDPYENGGTFFIQNNEESAVGIQRTVLRSCA
jgi:hypothetical protein